MAVAVAIAAYSISTRSPTNPPISVGTPATSDVSGTVPSADFLKSHPEALSDAQKRCDSESGQGVVALCDAVHSAKASLLADRFRKGAGGSAK